MEMEGVEAALPPVASAQPAHHLFTVVADQAVDREEVRSALAAAGVQTSVHYPPVHRFSIYADGGWDLPATERYGASTITLPMFAHMTEQQQELVLTSLADALAARVASHA
jgi:dTDP-4-amino-4,6-dideoxygalactose transaminase